MKVLSHMNLSVVKWYNQDDVALLLTLKKPSDSQLVACLRKYFSASLDMWCSDFIVHKPHTCGHTHMLHICTHTQTLSELLVA